MVQRTFEFDDYPEKGDELIEALDLLRSKYPNFKCTVFAVPDWMTEEAWKPLLDRADWVRVGVHGFAHTRRECRVPRKFNKRLGQLEELRHDPRWSCVFKAPWYGYSQEFFDHLVRLGYTVCLQDLRHLTLPTSKAAIWNIGDGIATARAAGREKQHMLVHPGRTLRACTDAMQYWNPEDTFEFVENLARPLLMKVYLGCGAHVWDGWECLDFRHEIDPRITRWEFPDKLPLADYRADIIFTSHLFNYIDDKDYRTLLWDCHRVLRAGGVLRLSEDRTDNGYAWRKPGQHSRGTGVVRSLPTRQKILAAMQDVGFQVVEAEPGSTFSPHKDVIIGDTRNRRYRMGHKFYLEGIKLKDSDTDTFSRELRIVTRTMRINLSQVVGQVKATTGKTNKELRKLAKIMDINLRRVRRISTRLRENK